MPRTTVNTARQDRAVRYALRYGVRDRRIQDANEGCEVFPPPPVFSPLGLSGLNAVLSPEKQRFSPRIAATFPGLRTPISGLIPGDPSKRFPELSQSFPRTIPVRAVGKNVPPPSLPILGRPNFSNGRLSPSLSGMQFRPPVQPIVQFSTTPHAVLDSQETKQQVPDFFLSQSVPEVRVPDFQPPHLKENQQVRFREPRHEVQQNFSVSTLLTKNSSNVNLAYEQQQFNESLLAINLSQNNELCSLQSHISSLVEELRNLSCSIAAVPFSNPNSKDTETSVKSPAESVSPSSRLVNPTEHVKLLRKFIISFRGRAHQK